MKWWAPFTSEQTVLGHGIYLAATALVLLFAPGLVRAFLQFPAELDWWNRVLALPVFNLGVLCIGSALAKSRLLVKLTAATRLFVAASVAMLVVTRDRSLRAMSPSVLPLPDGWSKRPIRPLPP